MTLAAGTPGRGERCFDSTHRSFSGDRRFDECQYRDHAVRTLHVRDYSSIPAVVGMAVDSAVVAAIAGLPIDIEGCLRDAVEEVGDPNRAWPWDEMATKATALYELWEREVRPTWPEVYATQLELHWEHDGVPYHAHLDVAFADGSILDLKTSEKRLEELRAATDYQLTYYAWALLEVYGHLAPTVGLDGLIYANPPSDVLAWNPAATKPWYDRQRSTRSRAQVEAFAAEVRKRELARAWADRTGTHLTNGRASLVACRGCVVKPQCPAWVGFDHERVGVHAAA